MAGLLSDSSHRACQRSYKLVCGISGILVWQGFSGDRESPNHRSLVVPPKSEGVEGESPTGDTPNMFGSGSPRVRSGVVQCAQDTRSTSVGNRCILLGLDGATYDLLDPWMDAGLLPNLKDLLARGAKGVLRSTDPPTTPPAWTSVLTGVNPGKHGIFDFRDSFHRDPRRPLVSSRSMKAPRIWQILNAAGLRTAIMNVPITFPPEPLDGFMISGMMTPNDEADYTYPSELKARLDGMVGHYVVDVRHTAL